jgi:hypothetical protein
MVLGAAGDELFEQLAVAQAGRLLSEDGPAQAPHERVSREGHVAPSVDR